jgi:hypothetical protein
MVSRLNSIVTAAHCLCAQASDTQRQRVVDDRTGRTVKKRRSLRMRVNCADPKLAIFLPQSLQDTGSTKTSLSPSWRGSQNAADASSP